MEQEQKMWRRSDKVLSLTITGYVFLMYQENDQPVLVRMGGEYMVPIFSTVEKLQEQLPLLKVESPTKIKQIMDGPDFVESIHEGGLRIMVDPHIVNGNTRFTIVELSE